MHDGVQILLKNGLTLSLPVVVEKIRHHEMQLDDFYFDKEGKRWMQLNTHPLIKAQLVPIPKKFLRL
jgi:hypothetical protein